MSEPEVPYLIDLTRDRPTGIAVVGCGYWGVNYVRVFSELPDATVVAVCDSRPSQLVGIQRRFPHVKVTTDIDEVLRMPEVDAVVIATSAHTHHELARKAMRAGRHVLIEKPITTTTEHALDLIEISEERDLVLLVGHTFLYNTGVRKVKELIDPEDVYYVYARRTSLGPIRRDVNAIWDLAPHDVSIFNYLLAGTPEWVSAVGARVLATERDDVAFISLGYAGGTVGHIHVSWADPNKVREVVVVGSNHRITFNDLDPLERVRVFDKGVKVSHPVGFGEHQLVLRDGDIHSPALAATEPLKHQCGHFLHCITRGEAPFTNGRDGLEIVRTLLAIDQSIALAGAPVTLDRAPSGDLISS